MRVSRGYDKALVYKAFKYTFEVFLPQDILGKFG